MRGLMLLALLAVGLPTAALASSTDFSFATGTPFVSGTFNNSFTNPFDVSITGSMNTIKMDTGTLTTITMDCPFVSCYSFTDGTVTVSSDGSTLFTDHLTGGTVLRVSESTVVIFATLEPVLGLVHNASALFNYTFSGPTITSGSASVSGTEVPEPGTLGLLGTGLIGLAGLVRRKLQAADIS